MSEILLGDSKVLFTHVTGAVLGSQKHSETHVSSSGGGGVVGRDGGYVAAPRVHSTVDTKHEFWVQAQDGTEVPFLFTNMNVPLREGQKVSILMAETATKPKALCVTLINHSSRNHTPLVATAQLVTDLDLDGTGWNTTGKILGLLGAAGMSIAFQSVWGGVATFVTFVALCVRKFMRVSKMKTELDKCIDHEVAKLSDRETLAA